MKRYMFGWRVNLALFAAIGLILIALGGCASCGPDNQKRDCIGGAGGWGGVFGGF